MTVWTLLDRIFGVVVPLCMVALVVMLWLLLSSPGAGESTPLRLRVVPGPRTEQPPPRSRRADASRDARGSIAGLAPRGRDVKETPGESAGRASAHAGSQLSGLLADSARADLAGARGDVSVRPRPPGEREPGPMLVR